MNNLFSNLENNSGIFSVQSFDFPNIGFVAAKLPNNIFEKLKEYCLNLNEKKSVSNILYGHIQEEYDISSQKEMLKTYIYFLIKTYNEKYPGYYKSINNLNLENINNLDKIKITYLWVNFQRKYEFNPMHVHDGLFSFVIWINIPYKLLEEKNYFNLIPEKFPSKNSTFNFCYTTALGDILEYSIDIDKIDEGTICLFPSKLNHIVYPFFTNDGYRISISGNVDI